MPLSVSVVLQLFEKGRLPDLPWTEKNKDFRVTQLLLQPVRHITLYHHIDEYNPLGQKSQELFHAPIICPKHI
jgi:hypothetical protein